MIRAAHERVFHDKTNQTLVELRQRFWITRGRAFVKKILHKCNICRRLDALSYKSPPTADLLRFRVAGNQAFENVACDLCGPLYYRTENNGTSKIYIAVFTCPTSRAIHLEIVQSLCAESFLQVLRRYVSRRGIPATILTDNAQYFKRTDKILKKLFSSKELQIIYFRKELFGNIIWLPHHGLVVFSSAWYKL